MADAKAYLKRLRAINGERERLLDQLNAYLYDAMDSGSCGTFTRIIETDLLNLYKIIDDAVPFYKKVCKSKGSHVLDEYIREENRLKNDQKKIRRTWAKRAEQRRIERIREAAKEAEIQRKAKLDSEVMQKKRQINEMLESELIR